MKLVKEVHIETKDSKNHKGFYINEKQRALEINDIELCDYIMINVITGSNHPWFIEIPKKKVISYLNGAGKPKVYNWHFEDSHFNKRLDMPDDYFHIIIGSGMIEYV